MFIFRTATDNQCTTVNEKQCSISYELVCENNSPQMTRSKNKRWKRSPIFLELFGQKNDRYCNMSCQVFLRKGHLNYNKIDFGPKINIHKGNYCVFSKGAKSDFQCQKPSESF